MDAVFKKIYDFIIDKKLNFAIWLFNRRMKRKYKDS